MSTFRKGFAILLLLTLMVTSTPAEAALGEIVIAVPAVYRAPDGSMKGSLGRLKVQVVPGDGEVFFSADPLTEMDTQGAARMAALIASYMLGLDPMSFDFYYRLESESLMIGGPSAGAAMTVATIAALAGVRPRGDVMITGMINPDGTIGPVGGIPEKLEAAAQGGAKLFLIPAGQRFATKVIQEERRIGPFIIPVLKSERVDLVEIGRELGVEVREVATVAEAVKYMLGIELKVGRAEKPVIPADVAEVVSSWVDFFLNESKKIRDEVRRKLPSLSPRARRVVEDYLALSEKLSQEARKEASEGAYYRASSLAFVSAYEAEHARSLTGFALMGMEYLDSLAAKAEQEIERVGIEVDRAKPADLTDLEALIAAKVRYYMARDALKRAATLASQDAILDSGGEWGSIHWLSYAIWRAKTAKTWLWLFDVGGGEVGRYRIEKVSSTLLYQAESVVSYALSLLQQLGGTSKFLEEASEDLNSAKMAHSDGDYLGSIGFSASSIARATVAIHEIFASDPVRQLEAVKINAFSSINRLLDNDVVPVLALSYAEAASTSEAEGDLLRALLYYELSAAHAHMLSLLKTPVESVRTTPKEPAAGTITVTRTETEYITVTETVREKSETQVPLFLAGLALVVGLGMGYALARKV